MTFSLVLGSNDSIPIWIRIRLDSDKDFPLGRQAFGLWCDLLRLFRSESPTSADGAALIAEEEELEYRELSLTHQVQAIAVGSLARWGPSSLAFLKDMSHHLRTNTGDPWAGSFLLEHLKIAICQGNRQSLPGTLPSTIPLFDNWINFCFCRCRFL